MQQYGLIGYPLVHSFSKSYFSNKFKKEQISDCQYDNFPLENINDLTELFNVHQNLRGLNVTIPYKQEVIPYLDELDPEAETIGAVNTIQFRKGKRKGYNTDLYGFMQSLQPLLGVNTSIKALILGMGGASKSVAFGLRKLGIPFKFVSRNKSSNGFTFEQLNASIIVENKLIVNTTPLGMYPHVDTCPPIIYEAITNEHILYDLVYNPVETLFLKQGKENGATIKNGLEMLHLQAEKSWEIWNS